MPTGPGDSGTMRLEREGAALVGAVPRAVLDLCERLRSQGKRAWIVGGCVRDLLRGREASDWDVATDARPKDLMRIFPHAIPTGIEHGTVTVVRDGHHYEVTTLRGEGTYSDGRRPDWVEYVDDITRDLARRDFTINAIALDPVDGRLLDPFGGTIDLDKGVLRAVGDPRQRFAEDGLRVLRAARFVATLELALDPETEDAIAPTLDTYRKVAAERVRDEWVKTMKARRPSGAFEVMRRTGILGVTCPEMLEGFGMVQNKWHAYDVWRHGMECMDACEADPILRISALLHDVGKPRTRAWSDKTQDYTFYDHDRVGAEIAEPIAARLRFSNEERARIVSLVRHHLFHYDEEWTDAAVRRWIRRVGPERIEDLLRPQRRGRARQGAGLRSRHRGARAAQGARRACARRGGGAVDTRPQDQRQRRDARARRPSGAHHRPDPRRAARDRDRRPRPERTRRSAGARPGIPRASAEARRGVKQTLRASGVRPSRVTVARVRRRGAFAAGLGVAVLHVAGARAQVAPPAPETLAVGDWQLAPLLEMRVRGEYWHDLDGADRGALVERARVGMDAQRGPVEARVVLQDARLWDLADGSDAIGGPGSLAITGAYEAWGEAHTSGSRPSFVRVGRQAVTWGEGRLLGAADWAPAGRWLDAVRGRLVAGDGEFELLAASLSDPSPPLATKAYGELLGARAEWAFDPLFAAEAYVLSRFAQANPLENLEGSVHGQTHTGSARLHGNAHGWTWGAEGALQLGRADSLSLGGPCSCWILGKPLAEDRLAWAAAGHLAYTFQHAALLPTARLGVAYASGDKGGSTYRAFDPLLPDVHAWHGAMDLFAWSNEAEVSARVSVAPWTDAIAAVEYRYARLAEPRGTWRTDYLVTIGNAPGNTQADLGHEVDVSLSWSPWIPVDLSAGYSVLALGDGARAILPSLPVAHFAYAQTILRLP